MRVAVVAPGLGEEIMIVEVVAPGLGEKILKRYAVLHLVCSNALSIQYCT